VLLVARMPVSWRLMRPASGTAATAATALRAIAAAHGPLKARARLLRNTRARGRLRSAGLLPSHARLQLFASFGVIAQMNFAMSRFVFLVVFGFVPILMAFVMAFRL
jgi:hypothetical protein